MPLVYHKIESRQHCCACHSAYHVIQYIHVQVSLPDRLRQGYLEVRDVATGEVVMVLELLSPTNKHPGEGRRLYEEKRLQVLGTRTHLVEVDLLRGGEPMTMWGNGQGRHYRILVSRSERRPQADLYAFDLPQPIPSQYCLDKTTVIVQFNNKRVVW